jgi:hypothetical protein
MEIKPAYVTFGQAEGLKKLDFNEPTLTYWSKRDGLQDSILNKALFYENHNNKGIWQTSRPEQWQVVEWLRVNHSIWIEVMAHTNEYDYSIFKTDDKNFVIDNYKKWQTPQEAYSTAFDYILNNLI